eukprot:6490933-Amphidinium_carterae.2
MAPLGHPQHEAMLLTECPGAAKEGPSTGLCGVHLQLAMCGEVLVAMLVSDPRWPLCKMGSQSWLPPSRRQGWPCKIG